MRNHDKTALETARATRNDELVRAHQEVHALICENQDNACTVDLETAMKVIALVSKFGDVRTNPETSEIFGLSYVEPDSQGNDLVWCSIYTTPSENGRYDACSASDQQKYFS